MSANHMTFSSSRVVLVGRLGTNVDRRVLPSGDELTVFTVVVDRPNAGREGRRQRVDAIACHTSRAVVVRRLSALTQGDWVEVEGSLRRRFWRAGERLGSATEVEVGTLRRFRPDRASMSG
jgi:single-strand DNA-binding protein